MIFCLFFCIQPESLFPGVIAGINFVTHDAAGKKAVANMSLGGGKSQAMNDAGERERDRQTYILTERERERERERQRKRER